nr:hypothetical protein [Tanacetum cinerariifolium]
MREIWPKYDTSWIKRSSTNACNGKICLMAITFLKIHCYKTKWSCLKECILQGTYTSTTVTIPVVPAIDDTLAVPKRTTDEIYSTVDACKIAHEMWIAIERLQQGKSLNIQDRTITVAGARETVGSQVLRQTGIQCFNCKEFGHFAKEYRKLKRVKDSTYHKEKMLLCKQAEKGVSQQAEQSDWLADPDEEIDEQELEA